MANTLYYFRVNRCFEFSRLCRLSKEDLIQIFKKHKLHRFNETMAESFYEAIQLIKTKYGGIASNIWLGNQKVLQ